jgi:hypothetical protein
LEIYGVRFLCDSCRKGEMIGDRQNAERGGRDNTQYLNRCLHCQTEAWLDTIYPAYRFQIKPAELA